MLGGTDRGRGDFGGFAPVGGSSDRYGSPYATSPRQSGTMQGSNSATQAGELQVDLEPPARTEPLSRQTLTANPHGKP